MPETRKPNIIRWDKFTVVSSDINEYGDLIAVDENGNEHKVKAKRDFLFNMFTPGTVVTTGIASYMDREYIATANISDSTPPVVKEAVKEGAVVKSVESKKALDNEPQRKNRCCSLSDAVNIAAAKINKGDEITLGKIIETAKRFCEYLDKGE